MAAGVVSLSAAPLPTLDLSGAILEGAYRLVRLIGQGGMGVVYEAIQLRLNKRVAVKIMSRDHTANTVSLARFHREAEITSKLGHPHLVNVIDFGTAESGEPYLVMEILDGEDLEMRLHKVEHLPLEAVVRITRQAASALGAAHAQDVVHRDMKPANIFLLQVPGEQEFVKVLDFGISKMKAARARLTRATAVVGSPIYMSPEQTLGMVDDTDHRADQWALACIAWEMISGLPPFDGDDVSTLFHQINRVDPRPLVHHYSSLRPDVESVLRKGLSKSPADRYPSIRDFGHALETAAVGRYADRTPPVMKIPDQWREELRSNQPDVALAGSAIATPGPRVNHPPSARANGSSSSGSAPTEIAIHTGEMVSPAKPAWRKAIVAVSAAAGILFLVGAVLVLRISSAASTARSNADTAHPSSTEARGVYPVLPEAQAKISAPTLRPPIPTAIDPPATVPGRKNKAKPASKPGPSARTSGASKHKKTDVMSKPRIFREL